MNKMGEDSLNFTIGLIVVFVCGSSASIVGLDLYVGYFKVGNNLGTWLLFFDVIGVFIGSSKVFIFIKKYIWN